jgi:anti-anti-sigma factor
MYYPTDVIQGGVIPGEIIAIRAHGRLNMLTAPRLTRTIRFAMDGGATRIALDLTEVESLDSSAIGAIIAGMKAARAAGGDLRLVSPGPQPSLVLEMTHLDRVLLSFPSVEATWAA